jgi:hypothetical protein
MGIDSMYANGVDNSDKRTNERYRNFNFFFAVFRVWCGCYNACPHFICARYRDGVRNGRIRC